jgi:hypothetical protein
MRTPTEEQKEDDDGRWKGTAHLLPDVDKGQMVPATKPKDFPSLMTHTAQRHRDCLLLLQLRETGQL